MNQVSESPATEEGVLIYATRIKMVETFKGWSQDPGFSQEGHLRRGRVRLVAGWERAGSEGTRAWLVKALKWAPVGWILEFRDEYGWTKSELGER